MTEHAIHHHGIPIRGVPKLNRADLAAIDGRGVELIRKAFSGRGFVAHSFPYCLQAIAIMLHGSLQKAIAQCVRTAESRRTNAPSSLIRWDLPATTYQPNPGSEIWVGLLFGIPEQGRKGYAFASDAYVGDGNSSLSRSMCQHANISAYTERRTQLFVRSRAQTDPSKLWARWARSTCRWASWEQAARQQRALVQRQAWEEESFESSAQPDPVVSTARLHPTPQWQAPAIHPGSASPSFDEALASGRWPLYNQVHISWGPEDIEAIFYVNASAHVAGVALSKELMRAALRLTTGRQLQALFGAMKDEMPSLVQWAPDPREYFNARTVHRRLRDGKSAATGTSLILPPPE